MLAILIAYILICMIGQPAKFIGKSLDGISAWAFNVLPTVLPFMFFTKILSTLRPVSKAVQPLSFVTNKLFKTPPVSAYTFVMAILSGYPVGSRMIADLYLQGKISRQEAFKMSSFCSTSGPMFIVGAVGIGMFSCPLIGYILFVSHIIGAIANGICWRNFTLKDHQQTQQKSVSTNQVFSLSEIVTNSVLSILSVGCIITIFFVVIESFSPIFSLFPVSVKGLFEGVVEITKGSLSLSKLANKTLATIICSFVISFGGISTILQSLAMLNQLKMPTKLFVFQKLGHAFFSCLTTVLLVLLFPI